MLTAVTVSAVPSMPIFTASTPMSVATWRTCSMMNSGGTVWIALTPVVFCAVSAVIAVIPWTPQRANAFRSAWIPAPPPESEPAIERTAGTRHGVEGTNEGQRRLVRRRLVQAWCSFRSGRALRLRGTKPTSWVHFVPPAALGTVERNETHAPSFPPPTQPPLTVAGVTRQRTYRPPNSRRTSPSSSSSDSVREAACASSIVRASSATVPCPRSTCSSRRRWAGSSGGSGRARAARGRVGAEQEVEGVAGVADHRRAGVEQLVGARGRAARDRAGDGGDGAAEVGGEVGGDERAGAGRGLDDDRQGRERGDDAVAGGEAPAVAAEAGRHLGHHRPLRRSAARGGGACARGTRSRRRRRGRRPARGRPAWPRAPRGARPSRCRAPCPETTGTPAPVRLRPSEVETSSPYGVARREPTIATASPCWQRRGRAGDVEDRRRVGQLAQPLGVAGLAAADRGEAGGGDAAAGEGGAERLVARRARRDRGRAAPRRARASTRAVRPCFSRHAMSIDPETATIRSRPAQAGVARARSAAGRPASAALRSGRVVGARARR